MEANWTLPGISGTFSKRSLARNQHWSLSVKTLSMTGIPEVPRVFFRLDQLLCFTMKVSVKIRYILVVLLVIFQWPGGSSALAEKMSDWSGFPEISCPAHDAEDCDMVESASQSHSHCGGMACGSSLLSPALSIMIDCSPQTSSCDNRLLILSLHTGYHSSLERPPSL